MPICCDPMSAFVGIEPQINDGMKLFKPFDVWKCVICKEREVNPYYSWCNAVAADRYYSYIMRSSTCMQ